MCLKICNSRKCCISIWSSWYSVLIVLIHVFLIHDRIAAILDLKQTLDLNPLEPASTINNSNFPSLSVLEPKPSQEYTVRVCSTCFSAFFLILFFVFSNKKIGNFSNDGVKLGRDFFGEKLHHHHKHLDSAQKIDSFDSVSSMATKNVPTSAVKHLGKLFSLIWRHFLPINSTLHLMSIFFLLVQDLIYHQEALVAREINSLLNTSCRSQNFTQCLIDILVMLKSENSAETLFQNPFLVHILTKFKLELISITLAYLSISIRYGSVFWYTNKTLAYAISSIGLFNMIEQLFQLYILFYISRQNLLGSLFRVTMVEHSHQTLFINDQFKLYLLFSFLSLSIVSSLIPIYSFSYLKYKERFLIEENLFIRTSSGEGEQKKLFEKEKFLTSEFLDSAVDVSSEKNTCFNYCPHLVATLQLVVICALKLPFSYDLIIYFNVYKDHVLMVAIINEIMHTIILLFIWLILTLKTEWQMHLRTSFSICHWTYHLRLSEKEKEKDGVKTVSAKIDGESDFFNSETLYRNEIRKSSRNLLQHNRNSASVVPAYVRPENRLNRMSQPAYLSSSTPSSRFTIPQLVHSNIEIPILKSPSLTQKSFNQSVPSSAYNQTVLYLKRPPASEYESRV
ncbi:tincar-like isoform X1 [Brachionus plicatilis]|uniref:Tincar-like isoform X1 n=1 Tax=Brachionus plicatilis TaxID=10195 RepID=A0A3M7PFA2_BRAPC|nr:tincar-like isoform X1 [Brachionus plicatilis]